MKPELLAPAGSWACLRAAIKAGADSVYLGIKGFNMRANASNFGLADLRRASKLCKENKIKIYVTLNIIFYDKELNKVEKLISKLKGLVDAVICWDLAIITLCKKYKVPFHVSTQASISNIKSANFYKKLGAKSIILARELNLKQVKKIVDNVNIKVETFVHGAMCYSLSGRCFFSQEIYKKSANRGECIQPCRRQYKLTDVETKKELKVKNNYFLSAKDLCCLPFLDKLIKSGISIFKIEGRSRSPEYVYEVVKVYREAIDSYFDKSFKKKVVSLMKKLEEVYNRKFSSGFYFGLPTSDDLTDIYGSNAKKKKKESGKVVNYYKKIKVAVVELTCSGLKIGDEILIIGKTTGLVKIKVKSLEINHKKVKKALKGQAVAFVVDSLVREGDRVYKIKKK